MFTLVPSQVQEINFVLVDASYTEVPGQVGVSAFIRKAGGAFVAATNPVVETSNGWYRLSLTATETNTIGPLDVYIAATLAYIQQNLAYMVKSLAAGCRNFTYTVMNSVTLLPE